MVSKNEFRDFVSISSIKSLTEESNESECSSFYGLYEISESKQVTKKYKRIHDKGCFVFLNRALTYIDFPDFKENLWSIIKEGKLLDKKIFVPNRVYRNEYLINCLLDEIKYLKDYWQIVHSKMFGKIQTPGERGQAVFEDRISMGILEYDEAQMHRMTASLKRNKSYGFLVYSLIIQVIHQVASRFEYAFVKGLKIQGETISTFDRNVFYDIIKKRKGIEYTNLEHHKKYTDLVILWNFIKHNNKDSFDDVKLNCPKYLSSKDAEFLDSGSLAMNYLKLDFNSISEIISGLEDFSNEFCNVIYDENLKDAKWNHYQFFLENAYDSMINELEPNSL